jgi:dTDP-4-amino-4,6-dideoxygalactose transaminase
MSDPFNFPQQELLRYGHLVEQGLERLTSSGQVILGAGVSQFEAAFAAWLGSNCRPEQVIGVANGTDALELALRAAGVGPGDRVLLSSHTAYATAAAVLRLEARPVFVDLEPGRSVLSPAHLAELLAAEPPQGEGRFKAVIAVHLYGEACDLEALLPICHRHGLALIEDCAQACGTTYRDRAVGTWGDFAAFSIYPTKNLAAFGDGGALVVNRPEAVEAARRSRVYGWDPERQAVQFGVNSRLDELQAWVLLGKLADLNAQIEQRRAVAAWYGPLLGDGDGAPLLPGDGADWRHSYHLYVIRLDPARRDQVLQEGRRQGLPLSLHYPLACHQRPYLVKRFGPLPALPETERRVKEILTLPLHPHLPRENVEQVGRAVAALVAGAG